MYNWKERSSEEHEKQNLARQIEARKIRLEACLNELGIDTLWDCHPFMLLDLDNADRRELVEDFVHQLLHAESFLKTDEGLEVDYFN